MTTKTELLQKAWHQYEKEHDYLPTSAREAAEWAVDKGLLDLPKVDPVDVLAEQMATALRSESKVDAQGRRYRVNHAVRIGKGSVQHTMWAMMGSAPHQHMERAFTQRREQIVGDCLHLKTDVDVYNDISKGKGNPQIEMVFDFTDDVAEREHARTAG